MTSFTPQTLTDDTFSPREVEVIWKEGRVESFLAIIDLIENFSQRKKYIEDSDYPNHSFLALQPLYNYKQNTFNESAKLKVLSLLESSKAIQTFKVNVPIKNPQIREITLNIMNPGDFIDYHTHDPKNEAKFFACITIQSALIGGELVSINKDTDEEVYHEQCPSNMNIMSSEIHAVTEVESGKRVSIILGI